jgi:general secretion pathway protein L
MSTLIVLLPLSPPESFSAATPFDYVLTEDDRSAAQHDRAAASILPTGAKGSTEVVAVVPAQALSWHRLELPRGSLGRGAAVATVGAKRSAKGASGGTPRLRAVLEGLLEDRLLEEPSELHFAVQPDARDGHAVWVAACERGWLRAALGALEAAKRPATRIVPEFAPPLAEGPDDYPAVQALQVLGTAAHPQLVSIGTQGVSLLPFNSATLALAQAQVGMPAEPVLMAEPAVAQLAEQVAGRPAVLRTSAERWLDAAHSPWDLAQFEFSNSGRSRAWKLAGQQATTFWQAPQWRAARWGAGVLVAAQVLGLNAWAWKESASLDNQRTVIRNTLTQTFPNVRVVVDAPLQMERELLNLRQAAGAASGRDLEAMLGALGQAAPPGQLLTAIDFSNGEGRFRGLAGSGADLAGPLAAIGYSARVEADQLVMQTAIPVASSASRPAPRPGIQP